MDYLPIAQLDSENDPWRRGIERPNAKRLSISLGPLVAQRSLLFRIKADLAGAGAGAGRKLESYEELEDSEDSPLDSTRLYSLTPGTSGKFFSSESLMSLINASQAAAHLAPSEPQDSTDCTLSPSSAISTASIYSQASWNPGSPSIASAKPRDLRRQAMAFSPSLRWDGLPSATSRLPTSLMSASVSLRQQPVINAPPEQSLTRKTLLTTPHLPPTPLSPLLTLEVSESGANAAHVVGSVRLAKVSPTPLVAVRRRATPAKEDGKWRPLRQLSITNPPVTEERVLVDQSTVEMASFSSPPDEKPNKVLKKKPSQDETDESKRQSKRSTKFGKVMSRFSSSSSKKDKHTSRDGKKRVVGSGVVTPGEIKVVFLPEVEMSPTNLSFSESLLLSALPTSRTPLPPMTQPLPPLPPLPTPTHARPLRPVHEAPPSTPARTPFAAEFNEEDLVALQGQRAQATRVHRRSRSSAAVLRTPGPQDVQTPSLPTISPQVQPTRPRRPPRSTMPVQSVSNETSSRNRSSIMPPPPPPPRLPRTRRPPSTVVNAFAGGHDGKHGSIIKSVSLPIPSLSLSSDSDSALPVRLPVEQRLQTASTHMPLSPPRQRNYSLSNLTTKTGDLPMRRRPRVPSAAEPLVRGRS